MVEWRKEGERELIEVKYDFWDGCEAFILLCSSAPNPIAQKCGQLDIGQNWTNPKQLCHTQKMMTLLECNMHMGHAFFISVCHC